MPGKQKKLVIIDSNALLHRAWHAVPPLSTKDGLVVNAVFGFTSLLLKTISELKPDYILAAFDLAGKTFRHEEYADYKAQRIRQAQEFYDQIPLAKEVLAAFHIPVITKEGFEADDVIGTIANTVYKKYPTIQTIIVTGDLDALQLVNDKIKVLTLKRGFNDTIVYDVAAIKERYGLTPKQLIDFKALQGDSSDNIKGVKGIGEKGASDLIGEFGSLDNLYKKIAQAKIKDRIKELLTKYRAEALASRKLVSIVTDLPLAWKLTDAEWHQFDPEDVYQIFQKFEFNSLLKKVPGTKKEHQMSWEISQPSKNHNYQIIDSLAAWKKLLAELKQQKIFSLDTETSGLDLFNDYLLGISLSWQDQSAYFINLKNQDLKSLVLKNLQPILENPNIKKVGHNIKFDYKVLKLLGIEIKGLEFDTMIAAYLINPNRGLRLEELAFAYLGYRKLKLSDLLPNQTKKKDIEVAGIPLEKLGWYACEDADITWRLYQKILPIIKDNKNLELLKNIELPLVPVLAQMELNGILLDKEFLHKMQKEFAKDIEALSKKIYQLAGQEFNISSPLQLKKILFEDLNISTQGIKKNKTGLSTAAAELDKMMTAHPIIPLISEYRELTKLQSTYISALPALVNKKTGRLHTSFNQTITATGRLSSSDPNLQNIPTRTSTGRQIRQAFVAPAGAVLLSADYSQIELRLAAALSSDPKMLSSFKKGEDIHARTAAEIHKIPLDKVTKEIRRTAKEVNFGVLYGLGSLGLSQRTGLTRAEAKEFINKYFTIYKKIKAYIDNTKSFANKHGFAQTIFGRRRYLPDIHSSLPMLKSAAERMAINMPLQGTAADLMKMAMIKIQVGLNYISPKAKLVLQVHDELVLEVPKTDLDKVVKFVAKTMENIHKLAVPLITDVEIGKNWGELKPYPIK
ncbi:MAG: DNA polymerase I [Patescibacteria group bacterium]